MVRHLVSAAAFLWLSLVSASAQIGPSALPSLPSGFKSLHKTLDLEYLPPATRGLGFQDRALAFQGRFQEFAPPLISELVFGSEDLGGKALDTLNLSIPFPGEDGAELPLEYAFIAFGCHARFAEFLKAYGATRLSPAQIAPILYLGLDESSLSAYLDRFHFSSYELCLIVSNLVRTGSSDLALWLVEKAGPSLDPEGRYPSALAAAAIEARDLPALAGILAHAPGADLEALRRLCLLRDFPEGMAYVSDPEADNFPLLKEAISLSNSQFVELLLPLYPRSRLSLAQASGLVDAATYQGRPRNDYLYLLLLLGGYDEAARLADRALEDILISRDYKPPLELGLRRALADLVLGHGANVNHYDPFYGPYLHWFASLGTASLAEKREMIKWLISRGADRWARREGLLYSEIPLSSRASINEKGVRLRLTPSLKGEVLASLSQGTLVQVVEMGEVELSIDDYTGLWYRVVTPGKLQGWVYGKYLTYIE